MVSVPLSVYGPDERLLLTARTVDLSTVGALVHGAAALRPGETVRVEVSRGALRNPLALEAEVVRISEPSEHRRQHAVAVRFTEVSPLDEAVLQSIIAGARG